MPHLPLSNFIMCISADIYNMNTTRMTQAEKEAVQDLCTPLNRDQNEDHQEFSFLKRPAASAIAISHGTNSLALDNAQIQLNEKRSWPAKMHKEFQAAEHSIHIHFKETNTVQCGRELDNILNITLSF